jgi:peptidyl-dipeptidase Dcp
MNRTLLTAAVAIALGTATNPLTMQAAERENPFLKPYETVYGIPPFEEIRISDFIPAIKAGVEEQNQIINNIVRVRSTPDFDNTILPLENASPILDRVKGIFYHYTEAMTSSELEEVADEAIPMLNDASNSIYLNDLLFQRIKQVYDTRDKAKLTAVQKRVVEKYYREFCERGAALSADKKAELVKVNDELSKLFLTYNRNLLNATNAFYITVYDKEDLAGLPQSSVAVAAEEAEARGLKGLWVFTLHAPSRLPVLQYADSRGLREAMYKGYTSLASTGAYDNAPVIEQIVALRKKKAEIMGFDNFAQMMTSRVMAKTPEAAEALLYQVFEPAKRRSAEEVADMQTYVNNHGGNFTIEPWDYYYYAEKVKGEKFNLDENELRPYFELSNVLKGLFYCAEKLYGIKLVEMPDAPKYMDEVTVYDVQDAKSGKHIAVFMTDYFPRASKRQGAWMEQLQGAGIYEDGQYRRPIVYNVGNFTRPSGETPSLLTLDELETTFHEFGHALQGMLTTAPYRSIAGTNVDRDYVEMCSQINEHWATDPEVLKIYAKHYKTGEVIPDSLISKMEASSKFNQGFVTTELAGAAILDLEWGKCDGKDVDAHEFEKAVADKIGMPKEITFRYRSPYFKHIFSGDEYASGYYTYLWAQVLEADAWELFEQKGIFDAKTAASFKKNILESGDTEDPSVLFKRFRGHNPDASALLRLRGLDK